jgi:hypothetical protein
MMTYTQWRAAWEQAHREYEALESTWREIPQDLVPEWCYRLQAVETRLRWLRTQAPSRAAFGGRSA